MPERQITNAQMESMFGAPTRKKRKGIPSDAEMEDAFGGAPTTPSPAPDPSQPVIGVAPLSLEGRGFDVGDPVSQAIVGTPAQEAMIQANQFAAGIGEDLSTVLGAPVEGVSFLMRQFAEQTGIRILDPGPTPFAGQEHFKTFFRWLGIPELEVKTTLDSIFRGAGRGVGASLPVVGVTVPEELAQKLSAQEVMV